MTRKAVLYRLATPQHLCPFGLKAKHLLNSRGFEVEDHLLTSKAEADALKDRLGVKTTPQVFIEGQRIGGHDDLRRHFNLAVRDPKVLTYAPILWVFASTALAAAAASHAAYGEAYTVQAGQWFVAFSMIVLAMLKLRDLESFSNMFLGYDLLARQWVPYAYIYPFAELGAGVLMAAGVWSGLSIPVALFIGVVGAASVIKAVYIDKRALKCACVGGDSNVPLGALSLAENLMMIAMAGWMAAGHGPILV